MAVHAFVNRVSMSVRRKTKQPTNQLTNQTELFEIELILTFNCV